MTFELWEFKKLIKINIEICSSLFGEIQCFTIAFDGSYGMTFKLIFLGCKISQA